ncbi:MAG TPA: hypothetical protein VG106_00615, partial [Vicinamibacterales bacterium]|nr:hypothetical protein [Vicinamibacterales bacterium]
AQLGIQALAVAAAIVYSGAASFALLKLISLVMPLRADHADETTGLDLTLHGEEAYIHDAGFRTMVEAPESVAPKTAPAPAYAKSAASQA